MKTKFLAAALIAFGSLSGGANGASILHYVDSDSGLVGAAVALIGETVTTTNHTNFITILNSQAWDLVIVNTPGSSISAANTSALANYISSGGSSILSHWNLNSNPDLATAFDVSVASSINSALTVYIWEPSSPLFAGSSDITSISDQAGDNGDKLNPINGAISVAGFTSNISVNESAIVVGNNGRTIANGWLFWDATVNANNTKIVANQISVLIPEPSSILLLGLGAFGLAIRRRRTA
jgi:hypothetical protein